MATYLQGVTDYIPDYQPFQPDLNFYANVLQTKQTQYDTNWKSLNNLYADLHNADLTHDLNIKKKDELLKQIDFNMKRVTGLDLSLQQNVDQATQVFRPFYEDKYLMKDMAWTKNYNNTINRALNLKNSQDEKMRAQYWDTGVKELQYRKGEFKNATLDETLNMGNASYTPYVNAMEKYLKLAKETGLSIDIKDVDESGLYFVREKNGKALISPLQNLFMSAYANDPALQAVYATQSYVKRKDYAEQYASKFNGNKVEAEKEYLREQYKFLQNYTAKKNNEAQESVNVNNKKISSSEKQVENSEANPYTESYLESLNKALAIDQTVANHTEKLNNDINGGNSSTVSTSASSSDPNQLDMSDMELARLRVDAGTASVLAEQDILGAADIYAYRDYVYEKSANPVGLEGLRHQNAMARLERTHELKKEEMQLQFEYNTERDRIKNGLDKGTMYYDKEGKLQELSGDSFKLNTGDTSGQSTDPVNIFRENRKTSESTTISLAGEYIGRNFANLSNLIENKEISEKEIWNALSYYDPKSSEAKKRYGTSNGYQLFNKLYAKYQKDPDSFILEFTKTNQIGKFKKFMDNWSNVNYGHTIAVEYKKDKSNYDIEQYMRYRKGVKETDSHNWNVIVKNLTHTIEAPYSTPETREELARLYLKYKNKENGDELFAKEAKSIINKNDHSRSFKFSALAGLDASMLQSLSDAEHAHWERLSGIHGGDVTHMNKEARKYLYGIFGYDVNTKKKIGSGTAEFKGMFNELGNTYNKTLTQTGPEGLRSYAENVKTVGGKFAFTSKDMTAKTVNLGAPGWGGFTAFQQAVSDINNIRFNKSGNYAVTFGGLSKTAAKDYALDPATAKALIRELQGNKKSAPFTIARSGIALEDHNTKAVVIFPSKELLKKYLVDDEGKVIDAQVNKALKYGISFIAPKAEWTNDFILENEITPTQQLLNANKEIKYYNGNKAGAYTIKKTTNVPGVDYTMSYRAHYINDDGSVTTKKDYMHLQKSGNRIDASEAEIFQLIQDVDNHNLDMFRKFQEQGNTAAMQRVREYFKNPSYGGFKY